MRRNSGYYPAFFTDQAMMPLAHPSDWLHAASDGLSEEAASDDGAVIVGEAVSLPMRPAAGQVETHAIGDVVAFDLLEAVGADTMLFLPDGAFRLQGGNPPESFDTCWNPADASAMGYETMGAFAAAWRDDKDRPVGIEFVRWTRGIPYRIEAGENGPVAAEA